MEVEKIVANPFQPRREFDQARLQELADSIRMYGVLQPLTVTRKEVQRDDGTFFTEYELIAGERRLRASKLAGVSQVPVIIREGEQNEQEKLELAIIENLQREDLNAVDRALAFRQLADAFGLSHGQVAVKVGRSREYVSNSIRLLGLPETILDSLRKGDISEGHARTLLMLSDKPEEQEVIYREILLKKLSVREVERIVRKIAADKVRKKNASDFDVRLIELEKQFTESLGTRVQIQKTDFGGKLTIDYFSDDDLAVILQRVSEERADAPKPAAATSAAHLSAHTPLEVAADANPATDGAPAQEQVVGSAYPETAPHVETVYNPAPTPAPAPQVDDEASLAEPRAEIPYTEPEAAYYPHADTPEQPPHPAAAAPAPQQGASRVDEPIVPPENLPTHTAAAAPYHTDSVDQATEPTSEPVTPEPAAKEPEPEDDSDLYSIRNFNL